MLECSALLPADLCAVCLVLLDVDVELRHLTAREAFDARGQEVIGTHDSSGRMTSASDLVSRDVMAVAPDAAEVTEKQIG